MCMKTYIYKCIKPMKYTIQKKKIFTVSNKMKNISYFILCF